MLRQMEYDADLCEAQLAGSDCFAQTTRRILDLSLAEAVSIGVAETMFETENRLADDWGMFLLENTDDLPPEEVQKLIDAQLNAATGSADTHPSSRDRIKAAELLGVEALFRMRTHSVLEAACDESVELTLTDVLLNEMPRIARELTMRFYTEVLVTPPKPEQLVPIGHVREHKDATARRLKAADRFFQVPIPACRNLEVGLDRELESSDKDALAGLVREARMAVSHEL